MNPSEKFKLETVTPEEITEMARISPEEYAIYSTKMEIICDEVKQAFVRMAVSIAVQVQDCTTAIYTAAGDLALAPTGTYLHVGTGVIPIKYILENFKDEMQVKEGDIFFCNAAVYGGIHNLDMLTILPIFCEGKLLAWAVVAGHEGETGAVVPGGYVPNAPNRFYEGMGIPPIRIGEDYQIRPDLLNMMVHMTRDKRLMVSDCKSRAACCLKLRGRILEIAQEKGNGFVIGLLRKVVESATEGAKAKIRRFNDGVYRASSFFDLQGEQEALGCVHVELIKKADTVTVNFYGVTPATKSYLNTRLHIVRAVTLGCLTQGIFSDLPVSTGVLEAFTFNAPRGTCVDAPDDSAISGSTRMTPVVVHAVYQAFMKMAYGSEYRHLVAGPMATSGRILAGGGLDQYGEVSSWLLVCVPNAAGTGARTYKDGIDAAGFYYSGFADSRDIEHEEVQFPVLYLFRKLPMDSVGPGKYRGGISPSVGILLWKTQSPFTLIFSPYNSRFPVDIGLFGGYAGGMGPCLTVEEGNWQEVFQSGKVPYTYHDTLTQQPIEGKYSLRQIMTGNTFNNKDFLGIIGAGNGGYGDALEREPSAVIEDLRTGIISAWTAQNVYHVDFDPSSFKVDTLQTQKKRAEEYQRRKYRGKSFNAFINNWQQNKPREDILKSYGSWPWGTTMAGVQLDVAISLEGGSK